jgi:hypothetical protein
VASQVQVTGLVTGGTYWFGDTYTGLLQPRITKMVLHSTETPPPNCPGYSAGGSAPTLTVNPWLPMGWQHFLANMSARALADPAGTVVRENRDDVAQIEIIGYADYRINSKYALANIPDSGLKFIADVLRFYNQQWGLPLVSPLEWPAFNSPRLNQVRLSGPQYDAYQGVLGHMHVSGNDHVDPAGLNIARILQLANQTTTPPPPQPATSEEDDTMPIFVSTTAAEGGRIYMLVPGRPKQWLNPQQWALWRRQAPAATDLAKHGSPYLESEVDYLWASIQPASGDVKGTA